MRPSVARVFKVGQIDYNIRPYTLMSFSEPRVLKSLRVSVEFSQSRKSFPLGRANKEVWAEGATRVGRLPKEVDSTRAELVGALIRCAAQCGAVGGHSQDMGTGG
jgi:hypothetical protein